MSQTMLKYLQTLAADTAGASVAVHNILGIANGIWPFRAEVAVESVANSELIIFLS